MPAMPCQDPWFSATADRLPLRQPAFPPSHPRSPALVLEETGLHTGSLELRSWVKGQAWPMQSWEDPADWGSKPWEIPWGGARWNELVLSL